MPGPFDNSPVISPNALAAGSPQPAIYQAQLTPALAALEDAWRQGIIKIDDMQKAGIAPKIYAAKGAEADLARQQAVADQGLVQPRAGLARAKIGADLQVLPSSTAAGIAQNDAVVQTAKPIADLTVAKANAGVAEMPSATTAAIAQNQATATTAPSQAAATKAESDFTTKLYTDPDYQKLLFQSKMFSTPAWQAAKEAADKTGRYDVLAKGMHEGKDAATVLNDISTQPMRPTREEALAGANNLPALQSGLGLIQKAREVVKTPGIVGEGLGEANIISQYGTHVKAAAGSAYSKGVDDARTTLQMTLAQGILSAIRSLAGSGAGRVMQSEIQKMGDTMPPLDRSPKVWNDWLDERENLLKRAIIINQKMSEEAGFSATPGTAPAAAPAASGKPRTLVKSQADYDALPSGTPVIDAAGNTGTKP
jgi:hypothetical protein